MTLVKLGVLPRRAPGFAAACAVGLLGWPTAWSQTPEVNGSEPTPADEGSSQAPADGAERPAGLGLATFAVEPADAAVRLASLDSIAAVMPTLEPIDPSLPLPLTAGAYLLYADRPGYRPATLTFSVTPGEVAQPAASLERTSAVLKLWLQPPEARVLIDGQERHGALHRSGVAPEPSVAVDSSVVWIEGLPPGSHELEVASDGFRSYYASLHVADLRDIELPAGRRWLSGAAG